MAHSYKHGEVTFIFDGGMEGQVKIRKTNLSMPDCYEEIEVPATALVNLVAMCYVQPRKVAKLELATADQLLGVEP